MRIIDCIQGSEDWERLRVRATASNFGRIVTPAKGDYSKSATSYAAEIVAKELGVYSPPPPSYWMEWGTENEPNAVAAYEAINGVQTQVVGFVFPDHTDDYGGSPDRLVGDDGGLEAKCPAPETLIGYHAAGELPNQYKPQVQGLMLITGREWWDFFAWHPGLSPFQIRVEPDFKYQNRLRAALEQFAHEVGWLRSKVKAVSHAELLFGGVA